MRYFNQKLIAGFFLVLVLSLIAPKPTLAFGSDITFESNPLVWVSNQLSAVSNKITAGASTVTAGATGADFALNSFKWAFELAGEALKQQLLDMMVDQIVAWIQGGGDPKFITDFPAFFRDAIDQAGGKFLQTAIGPQICSPFQPLLRAGFIPIATFTERTSCTLERIGVNIDVFLKDFRQGNWVAWNEMVLRPQNNVYGAYLLAWDQYEIEKSAAVKAAGAEAQAGKGFISVKGGCLDRDYTIYNDCKNVCNDDYGPNDATGLASCVANCDEASCRKKGIVTPGSVVGDMASKAVGTSLDRILSAQDLKAYIAQITNAILNRMLAEGVGLLHSALSSSTGGGGSGSGSAAQAQCFQLLGTAAYNDCVSAMQTGMDIREFQKSYLISQIDEELNYQNQLLGAKQATLLVLNQSVDILNQLGACQGTAPLDLAQVQNTASTTANQITQIQSDIIALQIKSQEIKAITDIRQITSFWSQVAGVVKPAVTQSLVLSAQQETSQKQQDMGLYQQQLSACQSGF